MTNIVERLRAAPCDIGGDHPDLHEQAADEIERLTAENKCLNDDLDFSCVHAVEMSAEIDTLTAEIGRYRAALERIAEGCDLSNEAQAIAREALDDE